MLFVFVVAMRHCFLGRSGEGIDVVRRSQPAVQVNSSASGPHISSERLMTHGEMMTVVPAVIILVQNGGRFRDLAVGHGEGGYKANNLVADGSKVG